MITAVFNDKMDYTIAYGLWQWDYGQVLRVKGLDFDQISIEVHFSLSPDNTDSLVTIGVVKDVDYQSTIVSDGEEYTVNETATVLDVVIPKDMLWNNIKKNYTIYVFLLSTNEESGETLKKIIMPVKVKPKPIYSVTPEDEELFHRVVEEVNTFAETAKEHSNISKSYAVGNTGTRENEDIDNAKYYAEQSGLSAEASEQSASNALVSENHALDSENSALGAESRARTYATEARDLKQEYDNTLALAKEYRDSAQASAISASANLRDTVTARNIATQASADANNFLNQTQAVYDLAVEVKQEVDETKADITAISTEIATTGTEINTVKNEIIAIKSEIDDDKAIIDTKKTAIDNQAIAVADNVAQSNQIKTNIIHLKDDTILIKEETSDIKDATDKIKTDVISIANNLSNSIDTKISEHNESTTAHPDIRSLISNLTNKLNTFLDTDDESLDQISELITFIQNNRTLIEGITTSKIDKNQGIENASKGLIVGEDGYVTLGDIGYYPVEITSVNSNYQANHTCKEISDAFKDGLIPYAFIHGVEQNIFYLMTCSESLVGFVYLTKDNISIITISQDNTITVNTNNPIIHTHQDISHKADKATTLSGYGITNAYTKGEVDNIVNNLDIGVTSVNNKTGDVTITAQELGALTEHQDISGKADKSEIPIVPTNVSAFTNDSGYINDLSPYIYYSQNSNTVYINSATETGADDVITINDRITAVENDCYNSYAIDTASGAIASFVDGADNIPLKSLVVNINPVQDLHGYDSPWVAGGGVNKWDEQWELGSLNSNTGLPVDSTTLIRSKNFCECSPSTEYAKVCSPTSYVNVFWYDENQAFISLSGGGGSNPYSVITSPSNAKYFKIRTESAYGTAYKNNIAFNYPSTETTYSPYENICSISGWDGMTVKASGKNLLDPSLLKDQVAWNIISIHAPVGTTLTMSTNQPTASTSGMLTYFITPSGTQGSTEAVYVGHPVTKTVGEDGYLKVAQRNRDGIKSYADYEYQIEVGSTATEYEPYNGTILPISWESKAGTVYGGKLDVLTGTLTVDRAMVNLGMLNWTYTSDTSFGYNFFTCSSFANRKTGSIYLVCDRYTSANGGRNTMTSDAMISSYNATTSKSICIRDDRYTTVADFVTSLDGAQLVYELATPIEIQLTPYEVNSFYGTNNIFADTGDIDVEYKADTTLYIERLIESNVNRAEEAKIDAQNSATQAGQSATNAQTSAQTASSKASEASQSASQALTYKTDTESARDEVQSIVDGISANASQINTNTENIASLEEDRYKSYVTDSASGAIASFTDGADDLPLKSLVVNINPVQDLHGYDSPWVAGGGKNLLPKASTSNMDLHGITATINDDGSIILNGTTTSVSYIKVPLENVIASGTACAYGWFNATASDSTVQFSLRQQDSGISAGGWNTANAVNRTFTFTTGADAYYWQIQISNEATFNNYKVSPMLVVGDTAPSTYTPYENICPISGWTGMTVNRTGVNLLGGLPLAQSIYNIAYKNTAKIDTENHTVEFTRSEIQEDGSYKGIIFDKFKPGKQYTFIFSASQKTAGTNNCIRIFYSDGMSYAMGINGADKTIYRYATIAGKSVARIVLDYYSNTLTTLHCDECGIFEGVISVNDFEPYNGTIIPIDWQSEASTVYGGHLDVLSGVLTINKIAQDMGTLTWQTRYTGTTHKTLSAAFDYSYARADATKIIAEKYPLNGTATGAVALNNPDDRDVGLFAYSNPSIASSNYIYCVIDVDDEMPNGLVVYDIATPIEIQLTPHEVRSLLGQNNIFADTGDSSVEYRADTKLYIERLTAPDSTDMIADSNIVNGQYFMVGNTLYKATANIANGGQIIVGTNCTRVSLATALNEINA